MTLCFLAGRVFPGPDQLPALLLGRQCRLGSQSEEWWEIIAQTYMSQDFYIIYLTYRSHYQVSAFKSYKPVHFFAITIVIC